MNKEAAEVVKRIYQMPIDGLGPYQIAKKLSEEQVLIPLCLSHPAWRGREQDFQGYLRLGFLYGGGNSEKAGVSWTYGQHQDQKAPQGQEKPLCF